MKFSSFYEFKKEYLPRQLYEEIRQQQITAVNLNKFLSKVCCSTHYPLLYCTGQKNCQQVQKNWGKFCFEVIFFCCCLLVSSGVHQLKQWTLLSSKQKWEILSEKKFPRLKSSTPVFTVLYVSISRFLVKTQMKT